MLADGCISKEMVNMWEQQCLKEHRWDKTCKGEIFLEEKVNSLSSSATPGQRGIFYACFTDHPSRYS